MTRAEAGQTWVLLLLLANLRHHSHLDKMHGQLVQCVMEMISRLGPFRILSIFPSSLCMWFLPSPSFPTLFRKQIRAGMGDPKALAPLPGTPNGRDSDPSLLDLQVPSLVPRMSMGRLPWERKQMPKFRASCKH